MANLVGKLPLGYEDWVEVSGDTPPNDRAFLTVVSTLIKPYPDGGYGSGNQEVISKRYFVAPASLPKVGFGGVIEYLDLEGHIVRAIRNDRGSWDIYWHDSGGVSQKRAGMSDSNVIDDCGPEGFSVLQIGIGE
jgi:hypothetical protein